MAKQLRTMDPNVRVIAAAMARARNAGKGIRPITNAHLIGRDSETVHDVCYVLREDLGWLESDCESVLFLLGMDGA